MTSWVLTLVTFASDLKSQDLMIKHAKNKPPKSVTADIKSHTEKRDSRLNIARPNHNTRKNEPPKSVTADLKSQDLIIKHAKTRHRKA